MARAVVVVVAAAPLLALDLQSRVSFFSPHPERRASPSATPTTRIAVSCDIFLLLSVAKDKSKHCFLPIVARSIPKEKSLALEQLSSWLTPFDLLSLPSTSSSSTKTKKQGEPLIVTLGWAATCAMFSFSLALVVWGRSGL
jgi:cytochrome b6-f complex subunit 8